MRVTVLGSTGRVGSALHACIDRAADLSVAEALSSTGGGGSVRLCRAQLIDTDVIVDFSSPAGTMALLDRLKTSKVPLVVGTTGFNGEQTQLLLREGQRRPILVSANFTKGFEVFARCAKRLVRTLSDARVTVGEVYNARKKPTPSGTTKRLCELLAEHGRDIETEIGRVGETPGTNTVTLDYDVAEIEITLTVRNREAYAEGALAAARWLSDRPTGFYTLHDTLSE